MKKQFLVVLVAFSIVLTLSIHAAEVAQQMFQDRPALTQRQKASLLFLKADLAALMGVGGALLGGFAWHRGWGVRRVPATPPKASSLAGQFPAEQANSIVERWWPRTVRSPSWQYRGIGGIGGLLIWYPMQEILTTKVFARWNSVDYRTAKICRDYNINVGQYRPILVAAESRKKDNLIKAIGTLYPKRFGPEWSNRIQTLFATYKFQATALIKRGSFDKNLTTDERDFVRMVELGAAMANLYYKTQPSRKKALDSAMKLYTELGYLT